MQHQNLFKDLRSRQIAFHSQQPAGTEHTAHGAADLSTDTDRAAAGIAHQHAFHQFTVRQPEQQLLGAIGCRLMSDLLQRRVSKLLRQLTSKLDRQVGHLIERRNPSLHHPLSNLLQTKLFVATGSQPGQQFAVRNGQQSAARRRLTVGGERDEFRGMIL